MAAVKFIPEENDEQLQSVLQQVKESTADKDRDYLTAKVIKETDEEIHFVVICVPFANNVLRIVKKNNEPPVS